MAEMSPLRQRMTEDMTVRKLSPAMERFQRLMADNGVACGMSQSGNVWDRHSTLGISAPWTSKGRRK